MNRRLILIFALIVLLFLLPRGGAAQEPQPTDPSVTTQATVTITSTASISTLGTFFDDFSGYPVGSTPSGWTQYGTSAIVPTIVNFGGTGSTFQRLNFPAYTAQSASKWLIKDNLTWASVTAFVKMNFQTSSDGAGIVLAWVDSNNFIAILSNPFWDEIVVWEFANGQIRSASGTGRYAVPIQTNQDYWLKATTKVSQTGDRQIDVWWSTDGTNYALKLTATGLANLAGRAGVGTYQFLSQTLFDDFSLSGVGATTILVNDSTFGYYNNALGTVLDGTQPQFPPANHSGGDPTIFPAAEPDLAPAASILGGWLSSNPLPLNANWSRLQAIPKSWAANIENAIIYPVDAGPQGFTRVIGNFGVDNGIFVWVNGQYKFGALAPGAVNGLEYTNVDLGSFPPGLNYIQILREDHGDFGGFTVYIIADSAPPSSTSTISGRVTDVNNYAVSGATVSATGPTNNFTTTDNSGSYTLSNLTAGTYTITPSKNGYTFSPSSRSVSVPPDKTGVNFTGEGCSPDQWRGEYYNNRDLQGNPILVQCDQSIDFYWEKGSPNNNVPPDNFSVRWRRTADFPEAGWYHFRAFTDDGLRLYIDGVKVIDNWVARSFTEKSVMRKLTQGSHQISMEYVEWSNDAMAHLTWYKSPLCPDNAIECSLNLRPMYQTQYLDKPMPSICTNSENQTIAAQGCTITSIAMALQTYGVNTTPQELNVWLSGRHPKTGIRPRGYRDVYKQPGDACSAYLVFDEILEFANEQGVNLKWVNASDAKSVLRNERLPVLMLVNGGKHYVLATDVVKVTDSSAGMVETLGIYDPHHAWACYTVNESSSPPRSRLECVMGSLKHATTDLEENRYYPGGGSTSSLKYLDYEPGPRTPSLQLFIAGAEVLLVDPQGRRVGYDRTTGEFVHEVTNSAYFDAEIIPPGAEPNDVVERTLLVSENAGGKYRLLVIAPNVGVGAVTPQTELNFSIDIIGFDSQFNPSETWTSGALPAGGIVEYQVNFKPGQDLTITIVDRQKIYLPIITK